MLYDSYIRIHKILPLSCIVLVVILHGLDPRKHDQTQQQTQAPDSSYSELKILAPPMRVFFKKWPNVLQLAVILFNGSQTLVTQLQITTAITMSLMSSYYY